MMKVHLVCNAHLDPVWLWQRAEGMAEAVSTFRVAAEFCETHESFVFCHNEAVLYEWVEEFEPALFERIRQLVRAGRWHIAGGWYLQPDCNLTSGESLIRQWRRGRDYFRRKFGVFPETAINFDPFGHSAGLVQILARCGFRNYLFGRPLRSELPLPGETFRWSGYAGSEVIASRLFDNYQSLRGEALNKLKKLLAERSGDAVALLPWGIGDHGGGPSRADLEALDAFRSVASCTIIHSTPDAFFAELDHAALPVYSGDLNPTFVGCYTSQLRIKQRHRRLENRLKLAETLALHAFCRLGRSWPETTLRTAADDLLFTEFHDILPGSQSAPAEADSLRQLDHGLEELDLLTLKTWFALLRSEAPAKGAELPVFVFNPHPWPVRRIVDLELQLADQNWTDDGFTPVKMFDRGRELPVQIEQEASNLNLDWRKRAVFAVELPPLAVKRLSALTQPPEIRPRRPMARTRRFGNAAMELEFNRRTGALKRWAVNGRNLLGRDALGLYFMVDSADSWGIGARAFREPAGRFRPMTPEAAGKLAGLPALAPIRVIESGPVRTVVEMLLACGDSRARLRYFIPAEGSWFDLELQLNVRDPDRMLKLDIPGAARRNQAAGQDIFGRKELRADGGEQVLLDWAAFRPRQSAAPLWTGVMSDSGYGLDFDGATLRLSLLRTCAYSAMQLPGREILRSDRLHERCDFGERTIRLRFAATAELDAMERLAAEFHTTGPALQFFPAGDGSADGTPLFSVSAPVVTTGIRLLALPEGRVAEIRLFNPADRALTAILEFGGRRAAVALDGYEFRTALVPLTPEGRVDGDIRVESMLR